MNAEDMVRAMVYYGLSLFGPTATKVRAGSEWHARDNLGTRQGFGASPIEAVENAVGTGPAPVADNDDMDFLK